MAIIQYNNSLIPEEDLVLSSGNRGFFYGDGFFETIRLMDGSPLWIEDHLDRMNRTFTFLNITPPFSLEYEVIRTLIAAVAQANRIDKGARVRITFFRDSDGLYTPKSDKCSFIIQCSPVEENRYELNRKGLHVTIYNQNFKSALPLASLKTLNSLIYVLAGIYARNQSCDDAFLINDQENIIETTSSNIFIVKQDEISTPGLDEGCIPGVMRRNLLKIIENKTEYHLKRGNINFKDIIEADEIFLTNAIRGIQWVAGVREKRYYHDTASHLVSLLNEYCSG